MEVADIWTKSLFPSLLDYIIMGVYLILMFMWAFQVQRRKRDSNPAYQYYAWGLLAKVIGAIALCLVYTLYYKEGGDTTGFYRSSEALVNLLMKNPSAYFRILLQGVNTETFSFFDQSTGYPWYSRDFSSFVVVRITSLFTILGFKNYFTTSILFAWFFYNGFWKLYLLLVSQYPKYHKEFAFSVLFFPSVLFWGSGILKDTISLSMTGWFLYGFFHITMLRTKILHHTITLIISTVLVIAIKPYIFVALIPGALIWGGWQYLKKINNPLLRAILAPAVSVVFLGLGIIVLGYLSPSLGEYGSLEGIINKVIVTYEDHSRATQYGYNYYSLGQLEGSVAGLLAKAPEAILAGIFRPFLWEVQNPLMLMAALENFLFMALVLIILWRTGPTKAITKGLNEPLVIFGITFALVFAFAVGISSANFGALVRLKIPLIPFLAASLFVLYRKSFEPAVSSA